MNERRHRIVELALSLAALGSCLAAGLWLFGSGGREHRSAGPVQEATEATPRATATLEAAAAAPAEDERRAAAIDTAALEVESADGEPRGAVEGVFLAPRSLAGDAFISLKAMWGPPNSTPSSPFPEAHFPVSEPWRLVNLAAGNWRFRAEVTLDDRRWSSDDYDLVLAPGAERRGVALALVECYAEGVVTDRQGLPVPGAAIELAWMKLRMGETAQRARLERTYAQRLRWDEPVSIETEELRGQILQERLIFHFDLASPTIEVDGPEPGPALPPELAEEDRLPKRYTTDATGFYRVPLRGPGRFGLRVADPELIAEEAQLEVDRKHPVAAHDFEVTRASSLRGLVSTAGGVLPEDVSVFLRLGESTQHTNLASDGTFQFERLLPGRYDFYARGGGEAGQDWSHHAKLEIPEGFRAIYDLALTPSFVVEGHLTDPDQEPDLTIVARGHDNPALMRRARVRADGTFTLSGLYTGEYVLEIAEREFTEKHGFHVDEANPPVFQRLELRPRAPALDGSEPGR